MEGEFVTDSLDASCYLVALGADLPRIQPGPRPGMCRFAFCDPEGWAEWASQEINIKDPDGNEVAMVSAPKLFSAMRKVRRLMNDAKGLTGSKK